MKPSNAANDKLIDRTIETWQPLFDRALSREDARQIVENVTGFLSVLAEWSRAEMPEPATSHFAKTWIKHVPTAVDVLARLEFPVEGGGQ